MTKRNRLQIFALLSTGRADKEALLHCRRQGTWLGEQFAQEVDCRVIAAGDELYLVPLVVSSPYHVQ